MTHIVALDNDDAAEFESLFQDSALEPKGASESIDDFNRKLDDITEKLKEAGRTGDLLRMSDPDYLEKIMEEFYPTKRKRARKKSC